MALTTPATLALTKAAVDFELRTYDYDPEADRIGMQAAQALGELPKRVLKTLIVRADGKPACVILASDQQVGLKKLASVLGAKSCEMMPVPDAERLTGYRVGGISPFGQKKALPTVLDAAAVDEPYVFVNGGQRGLQIRLSPDDIVDVTDASVASIAAT